MSSPTDAGTGALTVATVMAFAYGGVSMEHFLLGAACYVVGAGCRTGLKVGAAVEAGQPPRFGSALIMMSLAPFLGAFASLAVYMGAKVVGYEGDAAIALLLVIAGFRGAEGIQWLVSTFSKLLPTRLGGEGQKS